MMLTPEQQKVIDARGCNLLVSAAAGSGKTTTLVARALELMMKEAQSIDRMLIVTFTNAAASQMRAKLQSELLKKAGEETGSAFLQSQINLLPTAPISTLHSFCRHIVSANFQTAGVDPAFSVAENAESGAMKAEALEELFEGLYEKREEKFLRLLDMFASYKNDAALREAIAEIYEFSRNLPDPEGWMQKAATSYDSENFEQTELYKELVTEAAQSLDTAAAGCNRACHELRTAGLNKGAAWAYSVFEAACGLKKALMEQGPEGLPGFDLEAGFSRIPKELDGYAGKEKLQKQMTEIRKVLREIKSAKSFGGDWNRAKAEIDMMKPHIAALCDLVRAYTEKYTEKKAERSMVDFSDLEHLALKVLSEGSIAQNYREKFTYIFIDEYQDSNAVQEEILKRICRAQNSFMVGDVKQSIYQFRSADPSIFLDKYNRYSEDGQDRKRHLSENFRSTPAIVAAVNHLFGRIMTMDTGGVAYDEAAALRAKREDKEGDAAELHIVIKKGAEPEDTGQNSAGAEIDSDGTDEEDALGGLDNMETEAVLAVKLIREKLGETVHDMKTGKERPARYGDIAVLLRAPRRCANAFVQVLAEAGIPVYSDYAGGYFETVEVETVLDLLRLIDNSMQDIPLIAVMRSPIGGFATDELIRIRTLAPDGASYYEAAKLAAQRGGETAEKIRVLFEKIERWRTDALIMPLGELIWKLYADTGYYDYEGVLPGGLQRKANLRLLCERAAQFEHGAHKGVWSFLKYISTLEDGEMDMSSGMCVSEGEDAVRVMSVHKSKGLEFPIVIMSALGRGFFKEKKAVVCHRDYGIGISYADGALGVISSTPIKNAIKLRRAREAAAEEMRVLYVALTRAMDHLCLTGIIEQKQLEKMVEGFAEDPQTFLKKSGCYLKWIGAALLQDAGKAAQNCWEICYHAPDALKRAESPGGMQQRWEECKTRGLEQAEEGYDLCAKRLTWAYPYAGEAKLPSKLPASGLYKAQAGEAGEYAYVPETPAFARAGEMIQGAELGTAMHTFMAHMDFSKHTEEELEAQLRHITREEILTPAEAGAIKLAWAGNFARSGIGMRAAASKRLLREQPFVLMIDARELGFGEGSIPVQGVIDCCFEEDGGWVLIDYKTDLATREDIEALRQRYALQMDAYRKALEKLTGMPVKEKWLYSMRLDEFVDI
ncbi:MAG: helicase-exonuclease AddAB subunit AddA [Bacillota bacterium]|nr:helicase-exonuclease AddAB subunit AddA [Bacillota bacterium]